MTDTAKDRLAVRGGRIASLAETALRLKRVRDEFGNDPEGDQLYEFMNVTDWLDEVSVDELVNLQIVAKSAWDGK
jgi:hypothetical protein